MRGDADRAQRRAGEHHRDVAGRDAAALGDEFGLSRMGEAGGVERGLGDGAGDDRRDRVLAREADRDLEAGDRAARAGHIGLARDDLAGVLDLHDRQRLAEAAARLVGRSDPAQRAVPHRCDRPAVADREEGGEALARRRCNQALASTSGPIPAGSPIETAIGGSGVAHRYSITASRRRSRR